MNETTVAIWTGIFIAGSLGMILEVVFKFRLTAYFVATLGAILFPYLISMFL